MTPLAPTDPRPTLLIVDDHRALAENLQDIFEPQGFRVLFTPNAEAGLSLARASGFDLALVDVNLPDARGTDLLPKLREASPDGEVVLITGHATVDSAVAAVRGGAFHYVVKPFKVDELVTIVQSALRQRALRRERAALRLRLTRSERRYREVVESTQVVMLGLDAAGVVRLFNRHAAALSGYAPAEALGRAFVELLFAPEHHAALRTRLERAAAEGEPQEFEAPLVTRDGKSRTVVWNVVATSAQPPAPGFEDDEEAPLSLYVVGGDVTERRALERRAAEAEALAHMGTLAAGLAHEIRNPLNAALLQLHLLARGVGRLDAAEGAPLQGRITIVEAELRRLERLLSDFLELARPRPMAREAVVVATLLESVLDFHEPNAIARGITVARRIAPLRVVGDPERLRQVFHNLFLNAMEATPSGGAITVTCHRDATREGFGCVSFIDTGRGIARGTLEKVFEPFFTTKEAGTGLGLSIVRQIIERHGGRVELESAEQKGTRVTACLPEASG